MTTATITSKGQTTIPKEIREKLGLHPGDKVDFVMGGDGIVTLRPITIDIRDLCGFLKKKGQRVVTLEEMDAAIVEGALDSMK
jgi:AbrB family looped-hinge helix DNA binding protein